MTSCWARPCCRPPTSKCVSFGPFTTGFLPPIVKQVPRFTLFSPSSRHGFVYVRPTAPAFEAGARQEERDAHRRLSVSGERRRLAVTFPVKFSMQGQMQWTAAFHRDGFCIITANLHLWNRSVTILSRVTRESSMIILTLVLCSTADQTFKVALHLFPPPREDVDLQDPSATKYNSAMSLFSFAQPQQSSWVWALSAAEVGHCSRAFLP